MEDRSLSLVQWVTSASNLRFRERRRAPELSPRSSASSTALRRPCPGHRTARTWTPRHTSTVWPATLPAEDVRCTSRWLHGQARPGRAHRRRSGRRAGSRASAQVRGCIHRATYPRRQAFRVLHDHQQGRRADLIDVPQGLMRQKQLERAQRHFVAPVRRDGLLRALKGLEGVKAGESADLVRIA